MEPIKLTDFQIHVLEKIEKSSEPFAPYALEVGTCRALKRRGLIWMQPSGKYSIEDTGTEWLANHRKEF